MVEYSTLSRAYMYCSKGKLLSSMRKGFENAFAN